MSLIDSIKKIFVSPPEEEDIKEKEFENPLDRMPLANGSNRYAPAARFAELEAETNPRPEEEIADDITMHERMYKIATAKYNPFAVGGSENLGGSKK